MARRSVGVAVYQLPHLVFAQFVPHLGRGDVHNIFCFITVCRFTHLAQLGGQVAPLLQAAPEDVALPCGVPGGATKCLVVDISGAQAVSVHQQGRYTA